MTRSAEDAASLMGRLRELGAEVLHLPSITLVAVRPITAAMRREVTQLSRASWVAFASRHAVSFFADLLREVGNGSIPTSVRLAAVGPGTAGAVREFFRPPDLVAVKSTGAGLAEALIATRPRPAGPILLPATSRGRLTLRDSLQAAGFEARHLSIYETRLPTPVPYAMQQALPHHLDYALFTSPSSVEGLFAQTSLPDRTRIISIGPTTSAALCQRGLNVRCEAKPSTLDGLIEALLQAEIDDAT